MKKSGIFNIINAILLIIFSLTIIYPFIHYLAVSLTDPAFADEISGLTVVPKKLSFTVYISLLSNPSILRALLNSIFITGIGTLLNIVLTIITAYVLAYGKFPGKKLYTVFLIIPMLFNPGIIPNYMLIKNLNLLNTYWSVILPGSIDVFYLMILRGYFMAVPIELYEAARLDGANHLKMIQTITIPLAKPGIITIGFFYAIRRWNEYFLPLIYISDSKKWPLQTVLKQLIVESDKSAILGAQSVISYGLSGGTIPFKLIEAGTVILSVVPILIIYPFLLKYFKEGVMVGSIKG